jgi:hypothetical protein
VTFRALALMTALTVGGGVHLWHVHQRAAIDRELLASADSNGFVSVVRPPDVPRDTAVILAPLNCPSVRAKKADAMAKELGQMGITVRRSNSYSARITDPAQMPLLTRTNAVLGGEVPIVIINGMAKANPTVEEVALEFRRDK